MIENCLGEYVDPLMKNRKRTETHGTSTDFFMRNFFNCSLIENEKLAYITKHIILINTNFDQDNVNIYDIHLNCNKDQ